MPTCKKCFTQNPPDSAKVCCACGAALTAQHTHSSTSTGQNKIIDERPPEKEKSDFFSTLAEKLLLITILGICLWGIYLLLTGGL